MAERGNEASGPQSSTGSSAGSSAESRRVRAVSQLIGWGSRQWSHFAELARLQAGCRFGVVTLVGERDCLFVGRSGLDATSVPREGSLCGLALHTPEVFLVPDLLDDLRTRELPWVSEEPKLRFYASYPLVAESGEQVGRLGVADTEPRHLTDEQLRNLQLLARCVNRVVLHGLDEMHAREALRESHDGAKVPAVEPRPSSPHAAHPQHPTPAPPVSPPATFAGPGAAAGRVSEPGGLAADGSTASEQRLRMALSGANIGVWDLDVRDWTVTCSAQISAQLGERQLWMGFSDWVNRLHPDDVQEAVQRVRDYIAGNLGNYESIFRLRHRDGSYRWILSKGQGFRSRDGAMERIVGIHVDITRQRLQQEQLRQRTRELQQRNEDLDRFTDVASHDLRSPLRGLRHLTEWLEEDAQGKLNAECLRHLQRMRGQVDRMEALLSGLLAYSRAGREQIASERVDLRECIDEAIALASPPPEFEVRIDNQLGQPVYTARFPLQQVIFNLVSNAVKHHPRSRGRVEISCQMNSRGWLQFAVRDDGDGIPEEFSSQVFQMFHKLKSLDESDGPGIGLALVKRYIEGLGGEIQLNSAGGSGLEVHFTWPANQLAGEDA